MSSKKNELVVIIGAGRTGSSMLTRILIALGMSSSKEFIPSSEQNPAGLFEDKEIVDIHKKIYSLLNTTPYAPLSEDFMNTKGINKYVLELTEILKDRVSVAKGIWGFKDPRTAGLLPLWSRIFNPLGLVPLYIVTLRDPSAVVLSMKRQYNVAPALSELIWLMRTCDALYYSGGNCFIVHYEDWFTDKEKQLAIDMASFIGLSQEVNNQNINNLLSGLIKKNLNRSGYERYEVKNPFVKKLYAELKNCSGDQFDHERLMGVVIECREAIKTFSPWVALTRNYSNKNSNSIREVKGLKGHNATSATEAEGFKEDNSILLLTGNQQLKQIKELKDTCDDFRIKTSLWNNQEKELQKRNQDKSLRIDELQKNNQLKSTRIEELQKNNQHNSTRIEALRTKSDNKDKRILQLEKNNFMLKTSVSYKIGQTFVSAISRPGLNTFLLPYNFLKVTLETIFVRKHVK